MIMWLAYRLYLGRFFNKDLKYLSLNILSKWSSTVRWQLVIESYYFPSPVTRSVKFALVIPIWFILFPWDNSLIQASSSLPGLFLLTSLTPTCLYLQSNQTESFLCFTVCFESICQSQLPVRSFRALHNLVLISLSYSELSCRCSTQAIHSSTTNY